MMGNPHYNFSQMATVDIIAKHGQINGVDLRRELAAEGVKKSGPAFFDMMMRLESAGLIRSWHDNETLVKGRRRRTKFYCLEGDGFRALQEFRQYLQDYMKRRSWEGGDPAY